jgi:hypothetical protein
MRIKTIQKESGTYVRLPDDFRKAEELEIFQLRDGYYLLSLPLGAAVKTKAEGKAAAEPEAKARAPAPPAVAEEDARGLTQAENRVLEKLASIRFEKRTGTSIREDFSRQDREALLSLERKGAVTFIKSKKYPDGVYNIQSEFYPAPKKDAGPEKSAPDLERQLFRDGYIILQDSNAAQRLSEVLQKQKNAVTGVKGFDGKYYVVTRAHMERVRRVLARWRGDYVDPRAMAAKFGIHTDAVKAVLKILAEGGEYTEKGEVFIKVE